MTARLLTIMGSGETAPTMVKVHRQLLERVGGPAVLLDTPYGFQENADDISEKAQGYFAQSVGSAIDLASFRTREVDARTQDLALGKVAAAHYVFAGPGSPTYALRQWAGTPLPALLAAKLADGGAVTFASAAALTLGVATLPVYEVYKAGIDPSWRPGLDLLGPATGLRAAVIPHYDNAEGGHHDTRYCYLGERRLVALERELDDGVIVLGVDEHTALVLDLDAGGASVLGLGGVTIRVAGVSTVFPSGAEVAIADLLGVAAGEHADARAMDGGPSEQGTPAPRASAPPPRPSRTPLMAEADRLSAAFDDAMAGRDVEGAVNAILELDRALTDWAADTTQSDEPDRVRALLRSMIVRLGEVAVDGARDPREVVGPFVEAVLATRAAAREAKDWARSDDLRDRLAAAGVELRDTSAGQEWHLTDDRPGPGGG